MEGTESAKAKEKGESRRERVSEERCEVRDTLRESGFDFGYLDFWWLFYDGSTLIFGGSNLIFSVSRYFSSFNLIFGGLNTGFIF